MIGMLGGLGWSLWLLYETPKVLGGRVVGEHFGGSTMPLSRLGLDSDVNVYIGVITLAGNLLVVIVLSALLRLLRVSPNFDHTQPEDYEVDADQGIARLDDLLDGQPQRTGAHALR
jgi:SSS family solute:Na+ symporter